MAAVAGIDRAREFLDRHINYELMAAGVSAGHVEGLSLERMRTLVKFLGDPQVDYPVIHLTGTNGKGSTGALITRLLQAAGLSVGTYTSPHVSAINERIQIGGEPVDDEMLAETVLAMEAVEGVMADAPSWFELVTAAGFRLFADNAVDVAVVEVGMLGRYDATNVANGQIAVVTNVGFDHTDGGPGWREAVAAEKAGIIKPGSTLVLGETSVALQAIFAAEGPAATLYRGDDFRVEANGLAVGGRVLDLVTPRSDHREIFLSLHGAHQGHNAAIALSAAEEFLGVGLSEDIVTEAFSEVTLPGRFEVLGRHPLVVVDGAHNPDGAAAAGHTMDEDFAYGGRRILVFGMMGDRDAAAMLEAVGADRADLVIVCTPPSPRARPAEELAAIAGGLGVEVEAVPDVAEALDRALALADEGDAVFVLGSLYVAGAARDAYPDLAGR